MASFARIARFAALIALALVQAGMARTACASANRNARSTSPAAILEPTWNVRK